MTETEYLIATNRTKVSAALDLIRDVLPGDDLGITDDEHKAIVLSLRKVEKRLFDSFELEGDA